MRLTQSEDWYKNPPSPKSPKPTRLDYPEHCNFLLPAPHSNLLSLDPQLHCRLLSSSSDIATDLHNQLLPHRDGHEIYRPHNHLQNKQLQSLSDLSYQKLHLCWYKKSDPDNLPLNPALYGV